MKRILLLAWLGALCMTPLKDAVAQAPPTPEDDIRPAKPKVEIPREKAFSWTPVIAALVTAAALAALWHELPRRKAARRVTAPVDRALDALSRIDRERNTLASGVLADAAGNAVRQFIADRFGIAAPQRTTEEFLHSLTKKEVPALSAHRERLLSFLASCDLSKFAAADFNGAERLKLVEAAIDFVRMAHDAAVEQASHKPSAP
jgi:hypothetical protein